MDIQLVPKQLLTPWFPSQPFRRASKGKYNHQGSQSVKTRKSQRLHVESLSGSQSATDSLNSPKTSLFYYEIARTWVPCKTLILRPTEKYCTEIACWFKSSNFHSKIDDLGLYKSAIDLSQLQISDFAKFKFYLFLKLYLPRINMTACSSQNKGPENVAKDVSKPTKIGQ